MLIINQFPFADLRDLIDFSTYKLKSPDWQTIDPYQRENFLHRIGVVGKNTKGNYKWLVNEKYCNARRAFRFNNDDLINLSRQKRGMVHKERRLFATEIREVGKNSDGTAITYQNNVTNNFELSFIHSNNRQHKLNKYEFAKLINQCISTKIKITLPNCKIDCRVKEFAKYIGKVYLYATTEKSKYSSIHNNCWWIKSCSPLLIVIFKESEVTDLPKGSRLVKNLEDKNIKIYFNDEVTDKAIKSWFIETNRLTSPYELNKLLEGLLHINASQQCLNTVIANLDKISSNDKDSNNKDSNNKDSNNKDSNNKDSNNKDSNNKDSNNKDSNNKDSNNKDSNNKGSNNKGSNDKELSDKLQRYLEFSFASLFKRTRFGFPCKEFADVLQECEDAVSEATRLGILERLRSLGIRGNYMSKMEEFIAIRGGKSCMIDKKIDILLITAVKDEFDVVMHAESDWVQCKDSRGYNYYTRDIIANSGMKLKLGHARSVDMGGIQTSNIATRLCSELNPDCIAMVGICAGWKSKVNLGDIIVAERVFQFDTGKLVAFNTDKNIGENQLFLDCKSYNLDSRWKQIAQDMSDEWKKNVKCTRPIEYERQEMYLLKALYDYKQGISSYPASDKDFIALFCPNWTIIVNQLINKNLIKLSQTIKLTKEGEKVAEKYSILYPEGNSILNLSDVKVHVAALAASNSVIEDNTVFPKISRTVRTVRGLEMEGYAVGTIAANEDNKKFVIIKAVSDFADEDKCDHFREFSIEGSYRFLIEFLKQCY